MLLIPISDKQVINGEKVSWIGLIDKTLTVSLIDSFNYKVQDEYVDDFLYYIQTLNDFGCDIQKILGVDYE